jgi:hypothetical protein
VTCGSCGDIVGTVDDDGNCPGCALEAGPLPVLEAGPLHAHDYRPDPVPRRAPGEPAVGAWYLGVELEVELEENDGDDAVAAVERMPREWYAKEDGSLSNGLEFVSHPATWAWWRRANLGWLDRGRLDGRWSAYDAGTCGMHVHVSRAGLGRLHLWKLLAFASDNADYILRISRRDRARLEQWAAPEETKEMIARKAKGERPGDRYRAVNVLPRRTIEFRLFRGTIRPDRVRRNLAWVVALLEWTREASAKGLYPAKFHTWLRGRRAAEILGAALRKDLLEWSERCA